MTEALAHRLLTHARRAGLFPEPGRALLAVSGGPDSVALLVLFAELAPPLGLGIHVAHVDHGIAFDSRDTARTVLALAARLGVPADVARLALGAGASETRARGARYAALRRMQRRHRARYLVTAHHADDQTETVLFRFLRGSGIRGLAGIPAQGPAGLVRPLLPFTRDDLAGWLAQQAVGEKLWPVHHDPANADERHDRSWLRHHVLPTLRARWGAEGEERIRRVADHAAAERAAWASLLRTLPDLDFRGVTGQAEVARGPLGTYDNPLSEAVLRALAHEAGCVLGPRRAAALRRFAASAASGRRFPLGGGYEAETVFDRLRIVSPQRVAAARPAEAVSWGGAAWGRVRWKGWELAWAVRPAHRVSRSGWTTWVTPGTGEVRGLATGDRIVPVGGVGRRPVRRLLMEASVPWRDRASYPVVVREGAVLWVPGICRAAAAVPRPGEPAVRLEAYGLGDA